jgi:MFS family permease
LLRIPRTPFADSLVKTKICVNSFNLTLGAITTAVGIGAALSQAIAGSIVHRVGSSAGFLFRAVVAAAFAILYFFMPETRHTRLANQ